MEVVVVALTRQQVGVVAVEVRSALAALALAEHLLLVVLAVLLRARSVPQALLPLQPAVTTRQAGAVVAV